jgi:tetratricopeptide (TPR) repeat protein
LKIDYDNKVPQEYYFFNSITKIVLEDNYAATNNLKLFFKKPEKRLKIRAKLWEAYLLFRENPKKAKLLLSKLKISTLNEKVDLLFIQLSFDFEVIKNSKLIREFEKVKNPSSKVNSALLLYYSKTKDYIKTKKILNQIDLTESAYKIPKVSNGVNYNLEFFEPSILKIVSNSSYLLSSYYAEKLNKLNNNVNTDYYSAYYHYMNIEYKKVIEILNYSSQVNSKLLLASAHYQLNNIEKAESIYNKINLSKNLNDRVNLFNNFLSLNNLKYAESLAKDFVKIEKVKSKNPKPSRSLAEIKNKQRFYQVIADYFNKVEEFDKAADYYARGFKSGSKCSLCVNSPIFYLKSITNNIQSKNWQKLTEIASIIVEIEEEYPSFSSYLLINIHLLDSLVKKHNITEGNNAKG